MWSSIFIIDDFYPFVPTSHASKSTDPGSMIRFVRKHARQNECVHAVRQMYLQ
ncbi:MAG: hypothetical protein GX783_03900 [Clostridiales bacterium]|nr:hypothetical protein [Clostridiales bacterium]